MTEAWRLVNESRKAGAFEGEGARRYGGRWNHRGTAVVYLADSLSLAALETFVHLRAIHKTMTFATFLVEIPDDVPEIVHATGDLPDNWRDEPPPDECKDIGTDWVKRGDYAILRIPSVIVPEQNNLIVNIAHPDFGKLRISRRDDYTFDPRMWK